MRINGQVLKSSVKRVILDRGDADMTSASPETDQGEDGHPHMGSNVLVETSHLRP